MKFTIYATVDGKKCEFSGYCEDASRATLMKDQMVAMLCAWSSLLTELRVEM
jgi:hypothetical protein